MVQGFMQSLLLFNIDLKFWWWKWGRITESYKKQENEKKFIIDLLIKMNETIKNSIKANVRIWNIGSHFKLFIQEQENENNQQNLEKQKQNKVKALKLPNLKTCYSFSNQNSVVLAQA